MTSLLPQTPRPQRPARSAKITPLAPRATAVAAAALCLLGANVQALELGRADVRSAIGDRLLAEIVISGASERELAGLQASLAGADAYRAAGLAQDAAVVGAAVRVMRRGDGRHVIRVEGVRRVEEPFVDLIVQASTDSGRLVRIYTLLLDPKRAEADALAATAPPAAPAPARAVETMAAAPAAPPPRTERSERAAERAPERAPRAALEPRARPAPPPAAAPQPRAAEAAGAKRADRVRVRPGDSLSGIAARTRHANTNTDQMLVALYRNNPDAFIAGNADRLLAGVLLAVPDAQTAAAIPRDEARARIVAQRAGTRDALGETVSRAAAPRESKPARLELSDGAVVIAKRDGSTPTPALNLPSVPAPAASVPAAPAKPAAPVAAPTPAPVPSPSPSASPAAATAAAPATPGPIAVASAPAAAAAAATVVAAATPSISTSTPPSAAPTTAVGGSTQPAAGTGTVVAAATPQAAVTGPGIERPGSLPPREPGAFGWLLANPMVLLVGNLLLAALLVFSLWRLRSAKPERPVRARSPQPMAQPRVALPEPHPLDIARPAAPALPALTVATAAAAAATADAAGKAYSFDEIDTGATIDPLAEAEVYLNYGRDLQAEEILKDALRATPERLPIRLKLLEVYVKRRDRLGFQLLAIQIYSLTGGSGADWEHVQAMGQQLDPEDPLYQPGGQPPGLKKGEDEHYVDPLGATTLAHSVLPTGTGSGFQPYSPHRGDVVVEVIDLDLDLDLDADAKPASGTDDKPGNEPGSEPHKR